MNKQITFYMYRYHLLPLTTDKRQLELFPQKIRSIEELKQHKNEYFGDILNRLNSIHSSNPIRLYDKDEEYYLLKIANKKTTKIVKDFESKTLENEPYVYVIINNNPAEQKILISQSIDAFSSHSTVKNILRTIFVKELKYYGLNIEIEQMFDVVNFWKLVAKHQHTLTMLNFKFIKPNLANISKTLPEDIRSFSESVNGHETNLVVKAPENGILENINTENEMVNGLVDYSAKGGGEIKLKLKNIRKQINANEGVITTSIDEASIEGSPDQIFKVYKTLFYE
jgi:hypothetical protein